MLPHLKWKVKGVTNRWLINVLSVVVAVVIVVEIILGIFVQTYYNEAARSRANELCQGFSLLATVSAADFPATARQYIENFEHKDKIEIQIIDSNGKIIITSNGFDPGTPEMPDYENALKFEGATASWIGNSEQGERIMAQTTLLGDYGSGSNGAIRWIISLKGVQSHIFWIIFMCVMIGLGIIVLTAITGLYFIKSIVRPVQEVSNVARKMAMGDFKSRLEVENKDDEIGELCDAINYMASELGQAENLKNSFISSVSHELRTPLTAIRGWGETAKMSLGADDELVSKGLDVILSEADRLSGLVEDLLDFSRMQSGRLSVNMRLINIAVSLREAADMYVEVAKQHNIKMDFICPLELSDVMGDPDRLKQVFINVIDNAVKYSNDGGSVLIDCHEEEQCIHIRVSDTGVGIPEQDIDRVKEKFFKSNTTVRGSGIGLAVADEIIKQHNGLLFIESKEGVGTTVTIVLPMASPERASENEVGAVEYPPERNE
ncbi:MAG: HAMP domain-containing sensor histidine kinase [Acutalibacteraceae bacterium]|nr:HAMP domain-containing sensor histidine kinase [Acutalibacteraceae bacterium]